MRSHLLNKEQSPSKNLHHDGDSETGFLRKYLVLARRFGKKPSFFVGVYEIMKLQAYKIHKTLVDWNNFTPYEFEYDFEGDKLAVHGVTFNEAVQCFFSDYEVRRNKSYQDRYQLIGTTYGGRTLKIIFQLKPNNIVRLITGWPI